MTDTPNPGNWPNQNAPGVPANPERDGRHWIQTHPALSSSIHQSVWEWSAKKQAWWGDENGTYLSPAQVERLLYLGLALLPAEVAAREAAAFQRGAEAMREHVAQAFTDSDMHLIAAEVCALPIPEHKP